MPAENKQELLRYLKYAIDAERELAVLKQIRAIIEKDFDDKKPSLRQIEMPPPGPAAEVRKPGLPITPIIFAIIILYFFVLLTVLLKSNLNSSSTLMFFGIIFLIGVLCSIKPIMNYQKENIISGFCKDRKPPEPIRITRQKNVKLKSN